MEPLPEENQLLNRYRTSEAIRIAYERLQSTAIPTFVYETWIGHVDEDKMEIKVKETRHEYYDLDTLFDFGKYKGKTVEEIFNTDPAYLRWCLKEIKDFNLSIVLQEKLREQRKSTIIEKDIISGYTGDTWFRTTED